LELSTDEETEEELPISKSVKTKKKTAVRSHAVTRETNRTPKESKLDAQL
jgi:hypothetical protein